MRMIFFLMYGGDVMYFVLQALFEKIADRNAMAIRADKLFRLIFKAGQNKVTTERYRRILDIVQNENGKIKGRKGIFRVVSRGPFLAMFKHERYVVLG